MPTLEPSNPSSPLHAFTGFGIELEYMIVDRQNLAALPLAERLLVDPNGQIVNELEQGALAWSNELVSHVIELKTNGPADSLIGLAGQFHADLIKINARLADDHALLLPTAMHPLFDPARDTQLWPYGQKDIYQAYDRIFGCRGHGWSNLQSMHINLPFFDDEEFRRLHAAIRVVLPLIPALSASSPYEQGAQADWLDGRLRYYRDNQRSVPTISGRVIPEAVENIADYHQQILQPMYEQIAPHDPDQILRDDWLNSRAAIARFERQSIEIRIIDLQECPAADLAIAEAVVALVQGFYDERLASFEQQQQMSTDALADLLWQVAEHGAQARLDHPVLAEFYGLKTGSNVADAWRELLPRLPAISVPANEHIHRILDRGPLAQAIVQRLGNEPDQAAIVACYLELAECLQQNRLFGF